ncbi:hypothetical protein ABZX30_22510, partial [Streptomyces sp. NPDC004542]
GGQAPGGPQGLQAAGPGAPQQDAFGNNRGPVPPQRGDNGGNAFDQGRQPQLPPRGGPRAELPGGNPQQRTPSWGDETGRPPVSHSPLDAPRGHDEQDPAQTSQMPRFDDRQGLGSTAEMPRIDDRQGPAATGEFPRPDVNGMNGVNGVNGSQNTGSFIRSDVFGAPAGQPDGPGTGQFAAPQAYDAGSTGQFPAPGYDNNSTGRFATPDFDGGSTGQHSLPGRHNGSGTGQFERPQPGGRGADFGAPRPPVPAQQRPVRPEPEALPPATGPGDGRTPLYDTLETNWFHGGQGGGQGGQREPQQSNGSAPAHAPQQPQAPAAPAAPQRPVTSSWRTSPNDELVRQAERVRQPAAGGVTTSGLPRRVPRANLVPGTAQQQQHQTGPQVSRSPDDVRGRLTNLRRGIAQGRQAGTGQTGSFPNPTHQQER